MREKIKKGELFLISKGDYSSYDVWALMRALKNINAKEEIERFLEKETIDEDGYYDFNQSGFILWLIQQKIAKELKTLELWFTSYAYKFATREEKWSLGEL